MDANDLETINASLDFDSDLREVPTRTLATPYAAMPTLSSALENPRSSDRIRQEDADYGRIAQQDTFNPIRRKYVNIFPLYRGNKSSYPHHRSP